MPLESTHPRFDIRRATPAEFDGIYELVNESFGFKHTRAQYDWLYRRNPCGTARCWVTVDRASRRLIGSTASWPWPMARGAEPAQGVLAGDWVIAPGWQRQGIGGLRAEVRRSHPWDSIIALSWPNEKSRGAGIKRGRGERIVGPVPKAVLMLKMTGYLAGRGWPALPAVVSGAVTDAALTLWRTALLRGQRGVAFDEVRRFDSTFDNITLRCMSWDGFWSPHDSDFLNWRYVDHPLRSYVAFAVSVGGEVIGYYVLRVDPDAAWLMEFVAPSSSPHVGGAMLLHVIKTARDAGCAYLKFSAPPRWRHWRLFHAGGFVRVPSEIYLWPGGASPEVWQLDKWQWVPGDMDDI